MTHAGASRRNRERKNAIETMNKILPENILKCMTPEARRPLGKAGRTSEEAIAKQTYRLERELHKDIKQLLDIRGMAYIHSRTDKRSTCGNGVPDFIVFQRGFPELCFEVKVGKNHLSMAQCEWAIKYREATDRAMLVVYSLNEVRALLPSNHPTPTQIDYQPKVKV